MAPRNMILLVAALFVKPALSFVIVPPHRSANNAGQIANIARVPIHDGLSTSFSSSTSTVLHYTLDENLPPNASSQLIDTSCFQTKINPIQSWLSTVTAVERSEPDWLTGSEVLSISPSMLIQEHLDSLYSGFHAPTLFESEADRVKFDFQWRYALLAALPQSSLDTVLSKAMSNSHPLSMYLVACPPNCTFDLHVHPAVEVFVPLIGTICERRAMDVALPPDMLCRSNDMEVGGMGGQFTSRPTADEMKLVGDDISNRIIFEDCGERGVFTDRAICRGRVTLNDVGSVHQSYTTDEGGCLLFVLGSKHHGKFRRGSFRQRMGIDCLENIDRLMD